MPSRPQSRAGSRRSSSTSTSSSGGSERTDPPLRATPIGRTFAGRVITSATPRATGRLNQGASEYFFDCQGCTSVSAAWVLGYDAGYLLNLYKQGDSRWKTWLLSRGPSAMDEPYVVTDDAKTLWKDGIEEGWAAASNFYRSGYPALQQR